MGYDESDVYYQPEKFGLKPVFEQDQAGAYEFDMFVVWQHEDGGFYWAIDSGCSCPSPFEDYHSLAQLQSGSWGDITEAYEGWRTAHSDWREPVPDELSSRLMRIYVGVEEE